MSYSPRLFAYHGRCLKIDLSERTAISIDLPEILYRRFLGGSTLASFLLYAETKFGRPALDRSTPIVIAFSPLVGSPLTTSAKLAIASHSPLTQRINDSLSSSHFAIAGKKTGFDAFIIVGSSPEPVGIVIERAGIRFIDTKPAMGLSSQETETWFKTVQGNHHRVAAIGPAVENLVHYATVSNEGRHAGRGGIGAVWGSKKLKLIAVRGDNGPGARNSGATGSASAEPLPPWAHPDELIQFSRKMSELSFGPATAKYRELGTVSNLLTFNRLGTLPTRNFLQNTFESAEEIALEAVASPTERVRKSCAACTIGCEHIFSIDDNAPSVRMEYESLFALGSLCGISDRNAILQAVQKCDQWGLDTISTGGTIAFAMEATERGLLGEQGLRFGDTEKYLELIDDIAHRRGLGALLAEGSRSAAERIGQGSQEFAPHVKGLEIPGYDPRALQSMALGFAVGTRGADHNRSGAYQVDFSDKVDRQNVTRGDVGWAIETEDEATLMDSVILCKFIRGIFPDKLQAMSEMLRLVTGWEYSKQDLLELAQRALQLKKLYNIKQGWTPAEDTLPDRFLSEDDHTAGVLTRKRLQGLIEEYNIRRGWSKDGYPSESATSDLEKDLETYHSAPRNRLEAVSSASSD